MEPPLLQPRLTICKIHEILYRIGQTFSHVQYAVCGTAAMSAYGFTDRLPSHVSIVCPAYAKDVLRSWAAAGGMATCPSEPDAIGVTVAGGEAWKIRIKYLAMDDDHRFDRLETVGLRFGGDGVVTRVLTMPALVNQLAMAYIDERKASNWQYRQALARNVLWLLERICEDETGEHGLMRARIPTVRDPRFWLVFTTAHPEIAGLFYDAGLRAGDDEAAGDGERREEEPRVETSLSSHLGHDVQSVPHGRRRRSRAGSDIPSCHGFHRKKHPRDGPVLTRAEERAIMNRSLGSRRRSSGDGRRASRGFSVTGALDHLFGGGRQHRPSRAGRK